MRGSGLHLSQVSDRGAAAMCTSLLYTVHCRPPPMTTAPAVECLVGTERVGATKTPTHHNHNHNLETRLQNIKCPMPPMPQNRSASCIPIPSTEF
jgi:hypothetical protein